MCFGAISPAHLVEQVKGGMKSDNHSTTDPRKLVDAAWKKTNITIESISVLLGKGSRFCAVMLSVLSFYPFLIEATRHRIYQNSKPTSSVFPHSETISSTDDASVD
mmetsp:Transcript_6117/g.17353  ORF Transcript_6117/g.17353 Transcript_6117/m.17353 type:complete len:106 (-) Transcript_6117:111-428(-)